MRQKNVARLSYTEMGRQAVGNVLWRKSLYELRGLRGQEAGGNNLVVEGTSAYVTWGLQLGTR